MKIKGFLCCADEYIMISYSAFLIDVLCCVWGQRSFFFVCCHTLLKLLPGSVILLYLICYLNLSKIDNGLPSIICRMHQNQGEDWDRANTKICTYLKKGGWPYLHAFGLWEETTQTWREHINCILKGQGKFC